ncbi:MAG: transcriptional regulator BetI [Polymorphobacter sp.]
MARAPFHREGEAVRRDALIAATAQCLATYGAGGISVRMVAAAAGVSAGLVTHYFGGIDELIAATYRATGDRIGALLDAAVAAAEQEPRARLRAYVEANFCAPVSDPDLLATWAAFWALARAKPEIAAIHDSVSAATRTQVEALLAACDARETRLAAIGLTALIDGLWLERSLNPANFSAAEAGVLAERWLDALIG